MTRSRAVAEAEGLFVLDDAAQGFGATYKDRKLGTLGLATGTSFFPAKPLGCFGDGGAIFTDDDELARHAAQHPRPRPGHRTNTTTSARPHRAARHHAGGDPAREAEDLRRRDRGAQQGRRALFARARQPRRGAARVAPGCTSVWAQYTIRLSEGIDRDAFAAALKAQGVPTMIYYPKSMHQQTAYSHYPGGRGRPAGQRAAVEGRHQPADAPLSRRGDPGRASSRLCAARLVGHDAQSF